MKKNEEKQNNSTRNVFCINHPQLGMIFLWAWHSIHSVFYHLYRVKYTPTMDQKRSFPIQVIKAYSRAKWLDISGCHVGCNVGCHVAFPCFSAMPSYNWLTQGAVSRCQAWVSEPYLLSNTPRLSSWRLASWYFSYYKRFHWRYPLVN